VHESMLNPGWETALVAVPFLVMLFAGVFRLDELLVTQKASSKKPRPVVGTDLDGEPVLCDPDGRPSFSRREQK
jgi:hypothetical protein